ncbi:MAG TPA: hypothetical protein DD730_15450 [Desulfosporosinus sp.]|nr:hypothetical protein [Desulfosporosinus sp.]
MGDNALPPTTQSKLAVLAPKEGAGCPPDSPSRLLAIHGVALIRNIVFQVLARLAAAHIRVHCPVIGVANTEFATLLT